MRPFDGPVGPRHGKEGFGRGGPPGFAGEPTKDKKPLGQAANSAPFLSNISDTFPNLVPPVVLRTFRVLLVEDDAPLRQLLRTTLERSGRFVVVGEAGEGSSGIRLAASARPDLILLDLAMPQVGGMDALPSIRNACPHGKVVALSMLQREQWEKKVLEAGAVAFLDKATPSRELVGRLLQIMGDDDGSLAGGPPGPVATASRVDALWRPRRQEWRFMLQLKNPTARAGGDRSEPTPACPMHFGPGPR
jgi:CheY-like chemotaxis protein